MEGELRQIAREAEHPRVIFPGFINQTELPKLFGACDVFALPSDDEPWGLIINEAMCAGLPIVASHRVGCVPDLVYPGENGILFGAGNVAELTDALRPLIADPTLRSKMGRRSREIISNWSHAQAVEGLRTALVKAGVLNRGIDDVGPIQDGEAA